MAEFKTVRIIAGPKIPLMRQVNVLGSPVAGLPTWTETTEDSRTFETVQSFGGVVSGLKSVYVQLAVVYAGPGDVVPGAAAWWGIRAYSVATIGTACCRIKRADTVEKDIVTAASGIIDVSDSHFNGSTPYSIIKFFDQTGNGVHVDIPTTTAPVLTLNDNGSLPCVTVVNGDGLLSTNSITSMAQPFSACGVMMRVTNSGQVALTDIQDNPTELTYAGSSGVVGAYNGGNNISASGATEGSTNSIGVVYNGASSIISINGTNTGSLALGNTHNDGGTVFFPHGALSPTKVWEAGWWPSNLSASFAAISAQQHTVWNF